MYHQAYGNVPSAVYGGGDENASVVMGKGYAVGSRHGSPTPVPQAALGRQALPPMSPLPMNRRSFSRMSSQRGLEDTPLGSPMPMYPRRGRSVTFVGDDERRAADGGGSSEVDLLREERPFYHTSTADSAMKSSRSRGGSTGGGALDEDPSSATQHQIASIMVKTQSDDTSRIARTLPTPRKALMTPTRRSASRQRLESRRQQAVMNHSFYDDSFVEEFVTTAKDELEKKFEEEARQAAAEKERHRAEAAAATAAAAEERRQLEQRQQQKEDAARHRGSQQDNLSLSSISHQNQSGEDSRAMLARLLKEFSALEGSKPYITDMTPRKSGHNTSGVPPVAAAEDEVLHAQASRHVAAGRAVAASRQPSVLLPAEEHYESDADNADDYDDDVDDEARYVKARRGRAAATGGHARKKEARIESLIREAMRDYRRTKKSSVMLIDLKNLAESDSEAPTPEETSKRGRSKTKQQPDTTKELTATSKPNQQKGKRNNHQSMVEVHPPPIVVRKRARSEKKAAPALRQDSRPQFDDDSDDQDCDSDDAGSAAERPILLSRGSKKLPEAKAATSRQASRGRRVEAEVDAILGLGNQNVPPVMLPRAAPPVRPQGRGGRGRGKAQPPTEAAAPPTGVQPFVSPYVEPTLNRAAVAAARAAPAAQRKVDSNDPFAHFFDLQFDSPAKFDEAPEGTKATRRTNGGLMLASSCRTRRK